MSAREIIEELPRLTAGELSEIEQRISEIKQAASPSVDALREALLKAAGTCEGLPADYAAEHDHYLYGTPKRGE
jgi:hypothetical protein